MGGLHRKALIVQRLKFGGGSGSCLIDVTFEARQNISCDPLARYLNASKIISRSVARGDLFGFLSKRARDRDCLALNGQSNMRAPVTLSEIEATLLKRLGEGSAGIRHRPTFLDERFKLARMTASPLGLLPFIKREVARVALF
jgi:hypothetical protein